MLHDYRYFTPRSRPPAGGGRYAPAGTPGHAPAFVVRRCRLRPAASSLRGSHLPRRTLGCVQLRFL